MPKEGRRDAREAHEAGSPRHEQRAEATVRKEVSVALGGTHSTQKAGVVPASLFSRGSG